MLRILVAGVLGGIAMYVWSSVAHVATPMGMMGISAIPEEAAVTSVLKTNLAGKPGLYMFPTAVTPGKVTQEPAGLVIYNDRTTEMGAATLGSELVVEVAEGVVAAFLLSFAALAGYWARVGFVSLVGVAAMLSTNPSYWIWYKFPGAFTLANMVMDLVGYAVAGLVIAAVLRRRPA